MKQHINFVKKLSAALFMAFTALMTAKAQNAPSTAARPLATPVAAPAGYANTGINYIRVWEPKMPSANVTDVKSSARTAVEVSRSTQYFDGLGRFVQNVVKQSSPSGKDVVNFVRFDELGRVAYSYLPYVPQTGNASDGTFKIDPNSTQSAFFKNATLNPGAVGDQIFYSETEYEPAPLNRVLKTYSPGNAWAKTGGNHPAADSEQVNSEADSVRQFTITIAPIPTSTGFYAAGTLTKTISTDENGRQVIAYTDLDDQVVLRKVQEAPNPGTAHMGWMCTYYVYDQQKDLRFVLQPRAVEMILGTWTITTAIARELCFMYRYNAKGLKVMEKIPGADSMDYVYNKRDQLTLFRDGNLKETGRWKVFKYDALGRETLTGIHFNAQARQEWEDHYAFYPFADSSALPLNSDSNLYILTYTYYDTYDFPDKQAYSTTHIGKVQARANPYSEALPNTPSGVTRGLVTGVRTRVEQQDQFLTTTNYYDDKGRLIQATEGTVSGGRTTTNTLYDFSGKVLSTHVEYYNPKCSTTTYIRVLTTNDYDANGRLDSVQQWINDDPASRKILAVCTYDELGRLKTKRLNVTGSSAQMETLNYEYNLRDQATSINKSFINTAGSTANWFGEQLGYDTGYTLLRYNGDIAGKKWKSRADGIARQYCFNYSTSGQFTAAGFLQQNSGSINWTADKVDFSVRNLAYDKNNNILSMTQAGMKGSMIALMDSLKMGYIAGSNKPQWVTDKVNDPNSKAGDFKEIVNSESNDYNYNTAGYMVKDRNRGIDTMYISHNGSPAIINNSGKGRIYYWLTGNKKKVSKIVEDFSAGVAVTVTNYENGFIAIDDTVVCFSHPEGRVYILNKPGQPAQFIYEYFIKDYLGSIRVVLSERKDTATYSASMETARAAIEEATFSNITTTRSAKPAGYPTDNTTSPNDYLAKTNAQNGQRIGPAKYLYVMAGDTIQVAAKAFYKSASASTAYATPAQMLTSIVQSFLTLGTSNGVHNATGPNSPINTTFTSTDYTNVRNNDPSQNLSDKPKAYLNLLAFDNQFNLVAENSLVKQVQGAPDALQNLATGKIVVKRSGYLYIYASNESAQDVYFDNIVIQHLRGPLTQDAHYYPHGLMMAGISSDAFGGDYYGKNNYLFTGKELQRGEHRDGTDQNLYDYENRFYDVQIGMFHAPDPLANSMRRMSPYAYAFNNPIRFTDPDGMMPMDASAFGGPGSSLLNIVNVDAALQRVKQTVNAVAAGMAGAANAYASNQLLGAGRMDVEKTGLNGVDAITYQFGQKLGDAAAMFTGTQEIIGGGGASIGSAGAAAAVGVPIAIHGATAFGLGAKNLFSNPIRNIEGKKPKGSANEVSNDARRYGQQKHKEIQDNAKKKEKGWKTEQVATDPQTGKPVRVDLLTPDGSPVEIKPGTPSGRAKGAKQLPQYERAFGKKGRIIYYQPPAASNPASDAANGY